MVNTPTPLAVAWSAAVLSRNVVTRAVVTSPPVAAPQNAGAAFRPVDVVLAQGDGGLDHYMAVALVRHDHAGNILVFGLFRSDWAVTRRSSCRPAKLGSQRVVLGQRLVDIVQVKLPLGPME